MLLISLFCDKNAKRNAFFFFFEDYKDAYTGTYTKL
jgi:hypothetical protein